LSENIAANDIFNKIFQDEEYLQYQSQIDKIFLPEFTTFVQEILPKITTELSHISDNLQNNENINSLYKYFHYIKNAADFLKQDLTSQLAEETSILLDGCKKGTTKINKNIIALFLSSANLIYEICNNQALNNDSGFKQKVLEHFSAIEEEENNNLEALIEGELPIIEQSNEKTCDIFDLKIAEAFEKLELLIIELESSENNKQFLVSISDILHYLQALTGFARISPAQILTFKLEMYCNKIIMENLNTTPEPLAIIQQGITLTGEICEKRNIFENEKQILKLDEFLKILGGQADLPDENKVLQKETPSPLCEEDDEECEEEVDEEFLQDFIMEAKDHIENIDSQVIELEKNPENEEIIHSMFRSFHTIKGLAGFVSQNLIQKIAHQTETLMDSCRKGKIPVTKELVDIILKSSDFVKKICDDNSLNKNADFKRCISEHMKKLDCFEKETLENLLKDNKKIGEILVEQNLIKNEDVEELLQKQQTEYPELRFGEIAVKEEKIKPVEIINALKTQKTKQNQAEEYMRISTGKVDNLVDMVGELIIAQSLIEQHAFSKYGGDNFFITNLGRITRITKDLQNISMFLRMVALKSTFQKIARIARDTINELGKDIKFSTIGDETEIDRVVTEKLLDPLVHLVKNSISHGIGSKEERIAAGKPPYGNVCVNAYNKRGNIYIEITDDGKGIDTDIVYKKALEKGLIDQFKEYTEKEIQEFILLPGFSTKEVADNVSGRGVGMDVVKTEISKIGGKLEIHSVKGEGSKFILKIPVNHAIMNGTVVEINNSNYIIPTINVKQIIQPQTGQFVTIQGINAMIKVREDIIPIISISKLFKTQKINEETKLVVIVELDQKFKALPVKNVIGRQEIVVKPVGEEFSGLKYVSGMSILGDGKVSLILDIDHLFIADTTS